MLWEVAGVEVYERQVALGPRPEVHAVPGMVEVRASGASVAQLMCTLRSARWSTRIRSSPCGAYDRL